MDLGSLFLILALLILVGLFISRPFFENDKQLAPLQAAASSQEEHELSSLLAERDQVLTALQELDFDHALGKIPDEDYPAQRAALVQRGADILRQLDTIQVQAKGSTGEPDLGYAGAAGNGNAAPVDDIEARIEAAVAARRADTAVKSGADDHLAQALTASAAVIAADDDVEALLAKRRRVRQEKSAGFCPQCGGPVQKSDRFCPKCGTALS